MSEELAPTVSTDTEPRRRGAPGLTWAIILIAVGGVALLNNLKVINVNWVDLLNFWPVILILIGLDLVLGRRSLFGSLGMAAIAVVVIGGIVWFAGVAGSHLPLTGNTVTSRFSKELGSVDAVNVQLKLGAGDTTVTTLSGSQNVAEGSYTSDSRLKLNVDYDSSGSTGRLTISQTGTDNNFRFAGNNTLGELNVRLTDSVPVDLTVDAGVGEVTLDLTGIKLHSLTIKAGVGDINVILPASGDFTVNAKAGVGSLDIRVPKGLAARVDYHGGISSLDVPDRFSKVDGGRWETSGFAGAKDRVSLQIDSGIGSVDITE